MIQVLLHYLENNVLPVSYTHLDVYKRQAIKYTNEGGLITITMKKNSKDIEISIEDTGIGMSKEVVSHIFERFYREDKARNVEGNGLGLAIVKSIVDLHHGKIDILSQVDVGTNFIVRLPIEKQKLIERLKR